MGRFSKAPSGGGQYEQPPSGTHLGVCFRIVDLGTQHSTWEGEERIANQVLISWELPGEVMADGRPFSVSRFYTNSLHEKSALRKDLAAWRGRDFTEAELDGFDLVSILGKACLVSVVIAANGKAKVGTVLALPKGTPAPKAVNPLQSFFLDEWDDAVWQTIPKGIQRIVMKSDEYLEKERLEHRQGGETEQQYIARVNASLPPEDADWTPGEPPPEEDSELPF